MNQAPSDRSRVASGAGMAFLGRLGAVLEAISVVIFGWLYGEATFGLFALLWSYIKVSTAVSECAMTMTLQRFIPQADRSEANNFTGFAIKFTFLFACLLAAIPAFFAPNLVHFINAAADDRENLISIIQLYVWTLPFWTLVEVSTSAVRAKRVFGPEIKVRIFYEQGLLLVIGVGLALAGFVSYGLFVAHFISTILAGLLGLKLVSKQYDFAAVMRAPMFTAANRRLLGFGLSFMPSIVTKQLFSELPVMLLNQLIPGAAGAAASGYYAIARKIASIIQLVRLTFEYVMAPLTSEKVGLNDHAAVQDMYAFATKLSLSFALPLFVTLYLIRWDILSFMRPEFLAAATPIAILCAGRVLEAASGPSTAMITMIGNRFIPLANGVAGILVLALLAPHLISTHGVIGAAIAAAIGLNVTAWLAMLQMRFLYSLSPFNKSLLRPLLVSGMISIVYLMASIPLSGLPTPTGLISGIVLFLLCVLLIVRYGLDEEDAEALGKFGKFRKLATARKQQQRKEDM